MSGVSARAPGSYAPAHDVWGRLEACAERMPARALVVVDERVARLHPEAMRALERQRPLALLRLRGGERAKSLATLAKVLDAGSAVSRGGALVCVGGGTLGDLCTVAAHLLKRGVALIHVPTTLLAAVDSSLGGKGAVHAGAGPWALKNAAGVFHYAREIWLCPELFETLTPAQLREGAIEAWKMVACLDAKRWRRYRAARPGLRQVVRDARALKAEVCWRDPYEQSGHRRVLNFGHTFGHVLESVTRFRLPHGEAVGLGMLCALDVGRRVGATPARVADEVEAGLREGPGVAGRVSLARALAGASAADAAALLSGDKKSGLGGELNMVLLRALGRAEVREVPARAWKALWPRWLSGVRP